MGTESCNVESFHEKVESLESENGNYKRGKGAVAGETVKSKCACYYLDPEKY